MGPTSLLFLALVATALAIRYETLVPVVKQVDRTQETSLTKSLMSFGCSKDSVDIVASCYRLFLETYNLPMDYYGKLPPYGSFLSATSLTPFQDMCKPTNSLMNCLHMRVAPECLNMATFRILTYNDDDAYNYLSTFAAFEYICGNGFDEFTRNEECFIRSTNDPYMQQKLGMCGLQIDAARPLDFCRTAMVDAQCVRRAYEPFCGRQLAHGMCEVRVNFIRRLEVVDINCLSELGTACSSVACDSRLPRITLCLLAAFSFILSARL